MSDGREALTLADLSVELVMDTTRPARRPRARAMETPKPSRMVPEYKPAGHCTYPLGCSEPPLEGRRYCGQHAAQVDRRAAELTRAAKRRRT